MKKIKEITFERVREETDKDVRGNGVVVITVVERRLTDSEREQIMVDKINELVKTLNLLSEAKK